MHDSQLASTSNNMLNIFCMHCNAHFNLFFSGGWGLEGGDDSSN